MHSVTPHTWHNLHQVKLCYCPFWNRRAALPCALMSQCWAECRKRRHIILAQYALLTEQLTDLFDKCMGISL